MALEKKTIILGSIELDESYIVIEKVTQSSDRVIIVPVTYLDKDSKIAGGEPITLSGLDKGTIIVEKGSDAHNTYFSEEALKAKGASLRKNSYDYIKTITEFSSAKDV